MRTRRLLSLWLPVIGYMAVIFYESSLSTVPGTSAFPDTLLHGVGYGVLAAITLRATADGTWRGVTRRALILAWVIASLYGVSDEWHQRFTPGRTSEFRDARSDALGAAIALGGLGAWSIMKRSP